jgi:serine/threonine protein kinase
MEVVRGKDLREILKKLRAERAEVPLGDALFIVREVAQALHHAYWSTDLEGKQLKVVHRDVSPHNVMLSYDGAVKLLDFGVAMSSVTEQSEKLIVGKWQYMSPESAMTRPIDHRSDLFSLGVVLYLLCTGKVPFPGSDAKEILPQMRAGKYVRSEQIAPMLPPPLTALVHRMLSPLPEDRPQTGREVVDTLAEIERTYGYGGSASSIARLVSSVFPEERAELDVVELLTSSGSISASSRLGAGSGSSFDDSKALPPRARARTATAGTGSASVPLAHSGSVSLASHDRRLESRAEPAVRTQPTYQTGPSNRWSVILLLTIALAGAAVLYFVIRPS